MVSYVNELRRHVLVLLDRVPSIIAERDREHHTDAWPDSLDSLLSTLRISFNDTAHADKMKSRLVNIGQRTSDWNDKQWQETLLKVLGVDVYRRESWLGSHIKSFVNEGSSLITKLTEDTYHDVATTLTRGIRAGDRVETIKDALLTETDLGPGVFNKVETRARLIARDQIGKFNGELTRVRQESIGIKEYIWHTVLDERVRDSHASLEGMLCRWDDDTVYSDDDGETWKDRESIGAFVGQVGEDYQCRCWSEAVFPEEVTGEEPEEPTDEDYEQSDVYAEGRADGVRQEK
jgi:SPP1 gp7 family putative phage head morphogenesis protein